jgi:hypothetical protein
VANPEIVPIKALSPQSDKGWIIVRHHATEAAAHAYIDCVGDYRPIPYDYSGPMIWQTGEGVFTLMHRPPSREAGSFDRLRHEGACRRPGVDHRRRLPDRALRRKCDDRSRADVPNRLRDHRTGRQGPMTGLRRMPCRSVILDAEMCPPAPGGIRARCDRSRLGHK